MCDRDMVSPPEPFFPSVIEGITFKNTAANPTNAGPRKAISEW
jgi:hypothetical protein